jgi:sRNA-binding regulator protein Hfq
MIYFKFNFNNFFKEIIDAFLDAVEKEKTAVAVHCKVLINELYLNGNPICFTLK